MFGIGCPTFRKVPKISYGGTFFDFFALMIKLKMIKTLCSYFLPENMDNFKQSGSIFISIP
jgi:hypothetical protein